MSRTTKITEEDKQRLKEYEAEADNYTPEQKRIMKALKHGVKYRDSMCLEIIEMFSRGKTLSHFCATHLIGRDRYGAWRKKYKLFDEACIAAEQMARDYYDKMREDWLIAESEGLQINWGAFNKMYSARFNIADKRAVRVKGLGKAKDEREMLKCLNQAIEDQELTPDEAHKLAGLIDVSLKVKSVEEFEKRLSALEKPED